MNSRVIIMDEQGAMALKDMDIYQHYGYYPLDVPSGPRWLEAPK